MAQADESKHCGVLIVEDSLGAGDWIAVFLGARGYTTRIAHTAAEAMVLASDFKPQVVLMDLGLPDGNGLDLARRLRSEKPGTHFVALTGRTEGELKESWEREGFGPYISKPVATTALLDVLDSLRAT